jgi:hypothetical protein
MDEERLRAVERTVRNLELRLAALEARRPGEATSDAPDASEPDDFSLFPVSLTRAEVGPVLSAVGRSFVVLGGAFLLRAITDAQIVPRSAGIVAGMAYGFLWLWMAFASPRADRLSAAFHGLVAAAIGYPLMWEANVRFGVLSPAGVAIGLGALTAGLLFVALHRAAQPLAWIATMFALGTSLAFVVATGALLPVTLLMIAFGTATLWVGYSFDWTLLRWPVAFVADLLVIGLTMRATRAGGESPFVTVATLLLLLNAYIVSIAIRTLVRARNVNAFEVLQSLAVVTVGFGGAVYVARLTGAGIVPLTMVNLAAGASCYAIAWVFVATRQGLARNFYFYTSLGIVLLLVSSRLLLDDGALGVTCGVLAVAAAAVAMRSGRRALMWHGAVYLLAAVVSSGAWAAASDALIASASTPWRPFSMPAMAVIAASIACWLIARRAAFGVIVLWTAGGWAVSVVAPALCGVPGVDANAGAVATVRTMVLASAAIGAAWIAQRPRFRDTVWLLYGLLVAGGVKLAVEDLPHSKPATLFVALAFYGAALIAASRLSREVRTS